DPLLVRVAQIADQLGHLALGLGRIVALHIDFANSFAERAVSRGDAALPALALGLNAAQLLRIEIEAGVVDRLWKVAGVIRYEAEGEPFLPRRKRRRGENLAGAGDRR